MRDEKNKHKDHHFHSATDVCFLLFAKSLFDISQPNCEFRQKKRPGTTHHGDSLSIDRYWRRSIELGGSLMCLIGSRRCSSKLAVIEEARFNEITIQQPVLTAKYTPGISECGFVTLIFITTLIFFIHVPSDLSLARRPSITFNPICYLFFIHSNAFVSTRNTRRFCEMIF